MPFSMEALLDATTPSMSRRIHFSRITINFVLFLKYKSCVLFLFAITFGLYTSFVFCTQIRSEAKTIKNMREEIQEAKDKPKWL